MNSNWTSQHRLAFVGVAVLVTSFFALLVWESSHSTDLNSTGSVNNDFGRVAITERPAPNFTLMLFSGDTLELSSLKGKIVMVDFWASWCPPCREEAPVLATIYAEYRQHGVEFIGVDIWEQHRDDGVNYVAELGLVFPTGIDQKGDITVNYGVTGIPEKIFIDVNGIIVGKYQGPIDETQLRATLNSLLGIAPSRIGNNTT